MMRSILPRVGVLLLCAVPFLRAQNPTESAHDLIKDVVYNELQERQQVSLWQYRVHKRVGPMNTVEQEVETLSGPVNRVLERQGKPLDPAASKKESDRLHNLVRSASEQARMKQESEADEQRVRRMVAAMPDAFICTYAGEKDGKLRLSFTPNPAYNPSTYEARVFHALSGELWVDPQQKRLVRIDAHVMNEIDFGYGFLGKIDKGGSFQVDRDLVGGVRWKTTLLNVHVSGRIIFFKSINKDQDVVRSDFEGVPPTTTVADAVALLEKEAGP
jgi:hypothetical protein